MEATATSETVSEQVAAPVEVRFKAAAGSRFNKTDAERIGPELLRLKQVNGTLTKEAVVSSAKRANSPLHTDFEWDDQQAAIAHRLEQARYMMRSIMIVWDESNASGDTEQVSTRLLHSVRVPKEDAEPEDKASKRVFVSFRDVVENPEYAQQVIDSMEQALQRIDSRFRFYLEKIPLFAERFQPIFDEMEALEDVAT